MYYSVNPKGEKDGIVFSYCYSLNESGWVEKPSMQDIRNSAASSVAPGGWMIVTGGTVRGKKLHSVEEYNGREWSCGQPLPMRTSGHCQIQA